LRDMLGNRFRQHFELDTITEAQFSERLLCFAIISKFSLEAFGKT
jgi:hypothetical protein